MPVPCARATSAISRTAIAQLLASNSIARRASISRKPGRQRVVDDDRTIGGFDHDAGPDRLVNHELCTLESSDERLQDRRARAA